MNNKNRTKYIVALVSALILVLLVVIVKYYYQYLSSNVTGKQEYLYIHTGANYHDVVGVIKKEGILRDTASFFLLAKKMNYPDNVKAGKYRLKQGMSNRELINMLKAGNQEPVKFSYRDIRLKEDFAGVVAKKIEADSLSIIRLLDSTSFIEKYGFSRSNVYVMFIPNSYQLYWNTSAEKFFVRMYDEYQKFWTKARKAKAQAIGLEPIQVSILASIVNGEALHEREMPMIAGLYMNRYNDGIPLEADPTVIFAANDFTIHRVLNKHLRIESPYNTYLHKGLPPGPINMPSIKAIDAVLNYTRHTYVYMCAKEDFSGYHNFAATLAEHQVNAHRFQEALNERNIRK